MQSVFVIITKLIASKSYFCKEVFCNNFGRDGTQGFPNLRLAKHRLVSGAQGTNLSNNLRSGGGVPTHESLAEVDFTAFFPVF